MTSVPDAIQTTVQPWRTFIGVSNSAFGRSENLPALSTPITRVARLEGENIDELVTAD